MYVSTGVRRSAVWRISYVYIYIFFLFRVRSKWNTGQVYSTPEFANIQGAQMRPARAFISPNIIISSSAMTLKSSPIYGPLQLFDERIDRRGEGKKKEMR